MLLSQDLYILIRMSCGQKESIMAPTWGLWRLMRLVTLWAWVTLSTTALWWGLCTADTNLTSSCTQMIYTGSRHYMVMSGFYHSFRVCVWSMKHPWFQCGVDLFTGKPEKSPPPKVQSQPESGVAPDPCKATLDAAMLGTQSFIFTLFIPYVISI